MNNTLPDGPSADTLPQADTTAGSDSNGHSNHGTLATPCVAELMKPLDPVIDATHSLREAADRIALSDEAFAAVTLNGEVIGVLSAEDVLFAARNNPTKWQTQPCTAAISSDQTPMSSHDTLALVLGEYLRKGIRPLLVCHRDNAVGLLRPADVRRWCQDHDHMLWEDLFSDEEPQNSDSGEAG